MKVAANTAKILRNIPLPDEVGVTHDNAAVLDMGSYSTRLGYAGDNAPRMNERTVAVKGTSTLTFNRAYEVQDRSEVTHVMKNGIITDWEAYELLMQRVDDTIQLSNTELGTPLIITEKSLVPTSQRQKMAEILYEKHNVSSTSFALSPVVSLFASGLCTGVSVELGHDQCHVNPVFQGFSLFHAAHCLGLGGDDLTTLFSTSTQATLPPSVLAHRQHDMWSYLKEKCCNTFDCHDSYLAATESGDDSRRYGVDHTLPDGTTIHIGSERFTPSEVFFRPTLLPTMMQLTDQTNIVNEVQLRTSSTPRGIHELIVESVRKCDHDLIPYFYDNLLLSGGSSLYTGLPSRVESEVQSLLPLSADRVRVTADVERREAAFVGASILASLPSFQELWVTRADYEEVGSMAVVRGCFSG